MRKAAKGLTKISRSEALRAVTKKNARQRQRGVTLLEILVVLAIIGALVAVSAPAFDRYLDAIAFKSRTEAIGRDISRMRVTALLERRMLFFPQTDERGEPAYEGLSEPLPDGWEIEGQPVVFFDSGACAGGVLTVTAPNGRTAQLVFNPPHCRFETES